MVTYRFRINFEDFDEVVREIDIKATQTFEDLHNALHRSTGYNNAKSSSFYISTDNWLKGDEIALLPSERKIQRGVALMEDSKLKSFIEDPHQKFYYIYDFERPFDFHVELIKINLDADAGLEYPFLFKSTGEAPKIIDRNSIGKVPVSSSSSASEFDFLNELNFIPEDAEELESMAGTGINEKEHADSDEEEEHDDFEADEHDFEADEFGGDKNEDY